MIVARGVAVSIMWAVIAAGLARLIEFSWFGVVCAGLFCGSLCFLFLTARFAGFKK